VSEQAAIDELSEAGLLVSLGNSVFVVFSYMHIRCWDFDQDCVDIAREGYALKCWNYDRSRGPCPFVGS
jgi:hypothetical protein